jgi:hydrogenase expression/formation protein HypC
MCLAVPMKIKEIKEDKSGVVVADEATYNVNLSLVKEPKVGDFVIVHAGFAIEKLDEAEANIRIELFRELAEVTKEM